MARPRLLLSSLQSTYLSQQCLSIITYKNKAALGLSTSPTNWTEGHVHWWINSSQKPRSGGYIQKQEKSKASRWKKQPLGNLQGHSYWETYYWGSMCYVSQSVLHVTKCPLQNYKVSFFEKDAYILPILYFNDFFITIFMLTSMHGHMSELCDPRNEWEKKERNT